MSFHPIRRCGHKVLQSGTDAKIFQDSQASAETFSLRSNSLDFIKFNAFHASLTLCYALPEAAQIAQVAWATALPCLQVASLPYQPPLSSQFRAFQYLHFLA